MAKNNESGRKENQGIEDKHPDHPGMSAISQQAKDVASSVREQARKATTAVTEKAHDISEEARQTATNLGHNAEEAVASVGGQMKTLAHRLRDSGPREGTWGSASDAVASTLETGGSYLQEHDFRAMAEDVSGVVRNHPMPALLACIGLGFLLGRTLRS